MNNIYLFILSFAGIYVVRKALEYWRTLRSVQNFPGVRSLVSPRSALGLVMPKIKGINQGRRFLFENKYRIFEKIGIDVYYSITALPEPKALLIMADPALIKEVTHSRARFPKPAHMYRAISFYGTNIVASEGEEWKKYRKISAPAFSDRNNKLVWEETVKIVNGLFSEVWAGRDVIDVDHCVDLTLPIALFVIGAAGFGRGISWKEDAVIPPGHTMTFKEALHLVTTDFLVKVLVPPWAMSLTARLRKAELAFEELRKYMIEMIRERENADKIERDDLFSSLLAANRDIDSVALTDTELTGNIYVFLVAGHETTAHTLCFTFALLALYQDEQEKLFEHIKSVLKGRTPTYEDMPALTYAMAVYNETLRMFPPVVSIPKISAEDTSLMATNVNGEKIPVPIPKGTNIALNTAGLHYNSRYWKDPHSFKPERFLGDWNRDAFLPFSGGARACLGRKFFETEGIAILTMIISQYKITVKEEPQFSGETFEDRKARILSAKAGLTLTPIRVPLTFTKRQNA
ncbi:cytochrome P450 [Agrocybe pediades]|nr:cytochrome P450 [Agrocybe pediades]